MAVAQGCSGTTAMQHRSGQNTVCEEAQDSKLLVGKVSQGYQIVVLGNYLSRNTICLKKIIKYDK